MSGPPKSWTELRDLLGEADARKLVDAFGGEGLCIPKNYDPKHHLARKLGRQAFTTLTRFWGGCPIYIPTMAGARRPSATKGSAASAGQGATVREIARGVGLSDRQVRNILARRDA